METPQRVGRLAAKPRDGGRGSREGVVQSKDRWEWRAGKGTTAWFHCDHGSQPTKTYNFFKVLKNKNFYSLVFSHLVTIQGLGSLYIRWLIIRLLLGSQFNPQVTKWWLQLVWFLCFFSHLQPLKPRAQSGFLNSPCWSPASCPVLSAVRSAIHHWHPAEGTALCLCMITPSSAHSSEVKSKKCHSVCHLFSDAWESWLYHIQYDIE